MRKYLKAYIICKIFVSTIVDLVHNNILYYGELNYVLIFYVYLGTSYIHKIQTVHLVKQIIWLTP